MRYNLVEKVIINILLGSFYVLEPDVAFSL